MLQIVPDLDGGASAQTTIEIAAALTRVGARALVAARGGSLVSELQARGGLFAALPVDAKNPLAMANNVQRLARLIKAERIDLVHARSRASAWSAYGATRLVKTPFVTSFESSYAAGGPLALRYNLVMTRGDVILAGSAEASHSAARLNPATKDKVHIVLGGVDCRVFSPKSVSSARVQAVRRLWGVPPDARVALIALGPSPAGDCKTALDAIRTLAEQNRAEAATDAVFDVSSLRVIIGASGASAAELKEIDGIIAQSGLQDIVRQGDIVSDPPAALLAASVVMALSRNPGAFASLALEAQAMGAPILATTGAAAAETLLAPPEVEPSARTGWRTMAGDSGAIAVALGEALNLGATARDRLSLHARAHVERRFARELMWEQTLDAYAAALNTVRKPAE
ncbi:glycosyltransferase [Methylocella silvestris]|uniref:glycosyltransferase n=1 Tax=Methylocella silvestris TaxID=199596 RepID=UPI001FE21C8C|nr:glycosyltransferase [Methylocella silvestris]